MDYNEKPFIYLYTTTEKEIMENPSVISLPIDTCSSTAGHHSLTSKHLTAADERIEPE